jgi:acyl-coenzyme A thioesterase PaaI-like protein
LTNTAGGLQGGLIATMADVTAGQLAARSTPFGHAIATTDLFVRYLRPIKIKNARASGRPHTAHRQAVRRHRSTSTAVTVSWVRRPVNFAAVG